MPDIVITPNRGTTNNPKIDFTGTSAGTIKLEVLGDGSIAWNGANGSLFSIADSLSGSLMSVNDISGLPAFEVFSDNRVIVGQFGARLGIGTVNPSSSSKLHIAGLNTAPPNIFLQTTNSSANGGIFWRNNTNTTTSAIASNYNISDGSGNIEFITGGTTTRMSITSGGLVAIGSVAASYKLDVSGDVRAERYRGINSLVLNNFATVNPASNVFIYSQPNDRDSWIYLDSADTSSNWGIYHRQIDSAVGGLPANSIGFVGGGFNALQAYISLANGNAYFAGTVTATTFSGTASSVSQSATFNSSGSGDASPITYNGSTARTISYNTVGAAASVHNHTSLTSVTSIGFAAETSDSASISTTISGTSTYFDFNLSDDNNNDAWRWRFTPSGSTVYSAMTLSPSANGVSDLVVSGTVTGTRLISNIATGTAPLTVASTTQVTNLNAQYLNGYSSDTANTANAIVRRDASGNFTAGTITSSNLSTTTLTQGGTAGHITKEYTFNLSAQSNTQFFPIRLTGTPIGAGGIHTIEVLMDSFGGADPYNHHSVVGKVRGSGWTDLPAFYDVFHNCYQDSERSYLGFFKGTQNCTDVVLYVRGGKTYYVKTPSTASVSTTALTINDSVFAIKDSNAADVSGTSANISFMLNLITASQGRQISSNIVVSGSISGSSFAAGGNTVWHAGNDGSGSGLDADLLDGYNQDTANTANAIVRRDGSGNFSAGSINAIVASGYLPVQLSLINNGSGTVGSIRFSSQPDGAGGYIAFNGTVTANSSGTIVSGSSTITGDHSSRKVGLFQYVGGTTGAAGFQFFTADAGTNAILTERFRIQHDGNVGIATTSPAAKLEVNGDFKNGLVYRYPHSQIAPALNSTGWIKLATIPNNSRAKFLMRNGSANSEETLEFDVYSTYYNSGVYVVINRNTYNYHLNEIQVQGTDGQPRIVYVKCRTSDYSPTFTWQVESWNGVATIHNTEETPTSGKNFVIGTTNYLHANYIPNVYFDGSVGIGRIPSTKFNIKEQNSGTEGFIITNWNNVDTVLAGSDSSTGGGKFTLKNNAGTANVFINSAGNSYLNGGNVGVGITNPSYKLDVTGDTRISGNLLAHKVASYTTSYPGINSFGANAIDTAGITYYDTGKTLPNTNFRGVVWTGKHYIFTNYSQNRAYFYNNNFDAINNAYGVSYVALPMPSGYSSPHGAAWDGRYLWVMVTNGTNVKIVGYDIDTSTNATIIAESAGIGVSTAFDVEYADGHLYFANNGTLYIYKWNGSTIDQVATKASSVGSQTSQGITYDGSFLWTIQNAGSIYKINLDGTQISTIGSGSFPSGICGWAWNGSNIVAFEYDTQKIYIFYTSQYRIDTENLSIMGGNVGIGTTSPSSNTKLDVIQSGSIAVSALRLRAGNNSTSFNSNQLVLSYDATADYSHAIKTRHHASDYINAIDFYVWKNGTDAASTTGTQHVMTLIQGGAGVSDTGRVGIGLTDPTTKLDIKGTVTGTYASSTQQIVARFLNNPASLGSGNNSSFISLQTTADGGSSNPIARLGVVGETYGSNAGAFVAATRSGSDNLVYERFRIDSNGYLSTPTGSQLSYQDSTSYIVWSSEPEYSIVDDATDSNYKVMKTFVAEKSGSLRVKFSAYIISGTYYFAWRIRKNSNTNLATGNYQAGLDTGETTSVHAYRRFSALISVNPGDVITVEMVSSDGSGNPVNGNGQTLYLKQLRIYNSIPESTYGSSNVFGEYVGIGTTTPTSRLEVNGTTTTSGAVINYPYGDAFPLQLTGTSFLKANANYYGMLIRSGDANYLSGVLRIVGGSNKRVELYSYEETVGAKNVVFPMGNVGINEVNPIYKLDVSGDARITGTLIVQDGTASTNVFGLTTFTKSLTVTTSWSDVGISGSDLATGSYIIQVLVDNYDVSGGQYTEYYTGFMSWTSGGTNSTDVDEIVLHKAGHAPNGNWINLRTVRQLGSGAGILKLQIIASGNTSAADNYVFKFRRMI